MVADPGASSNSCATGGDHCQCSLATMVAATGFVPSAKGYKVLWIHRNIQDICEPKCKFFAIDLCCNIHNPLPFCASLCITNTTYRFGKGLEGCECISHVCNMGCDCAIGEPIIKEQMFVILPTERIVLIEITGTSCFFSREN